MKPPTLKAPGASHLTLKYDTLLSNVDFNCNLRRYTKKKIIEQEVPDVPNPIEDIMKQLKGGGGGGGGGMMATIKVRQNGLCSPRHPTHSGPSFIELISFNPILWRVCPSNTRPPTRSSAFEHIPTHHVSGFLCRRRSCLSSRARWRRQR